MKLCSTWLLAGCLVLALLFSACKKETIEKSRIREFSLTSTVNGGNYDIKVALPENYTPAGKYHTLYVLDAKLDFDMVAVECQKQARSHHREVIVVGIGWGYNRLDDYTPTPSNIGNGSADTFIRFIETELIPRIETEFHATPARAARGILGHSAGGLFVGHCFTNHNRVFASYLCLSPSFWYDDAIVLRNEQAYREQNRKGSGTFFLGLGEMEEKMRPPFVGFRKALQTYYPNYAQQDYIAPGKGHLDSKKTNISKALAFFFDNI
ncbi:alpha/beta hydrolase [Chitinophaga nivalis]|uniref:Alpha/beta hydrolase-fold protein n=1 Tax=Chitinophaga nivalis TaxID=2991709 RepID=A0ABT3IMG9_9BACT|nr:alpha/beta hydrolase-fold protein [Chitinophaga nivalis]MCW3465155.1 alpha/beta hydrolase-fold protein [Chitinophaga nivalis]MCW3485153.1 alpha/beta hydrolase-fold protein [Chitinophaga nivalis]